MQRLWFVFIVFIMILFKNRFKKKNSDYKKQIRELTGKVNNLELLIEANKKTIQLQDGMINYSISATEPLATQSEKEIKKEENLNMKDDVLFKFFDTLSPLKNK